MNFDLTTEQALLQDTVARIVGASGSGGVRRSKSDSYDSYAKLWSGLAENGLLAIGFHEAVGGIGPAPYETMIVGQELGRANCAAPFLECVVMPGAALRLTDNIDMALELASQVMNGALRIACILDGLVAEEGAEGWEISGEAHAVLYGGDADGFIAAAKTEAGHVVIYVPAETEGVVRRAYRTFDISPAATVSFNRVNASARNVLNVGLKGAVPEAMQSAGIAYLAAEGLGLMESVFDATVEHLRTRTQFGQPLASFQSLQHRVAEMAIALEQARSAAIYAAANLAEPDIAERNKGAAAANAVLSQSARFVGQSAVQLHGGIGLTEEHFIGRGLRRLTMIELAFGDSDESAARLASLGGFTKA